MSRRIALAGLPIDARTETEIIEHVLAALREGRGGWVCTVNLDILRQCADDSQLYSLVHSADLIVPDGMPLIWASRVAGSPLPERVAGSSLITTLTGAAASDGRSIFLLGGNPEAANGAARSLLEAFPALRVAGTYCPPFGFETDRPNRAAIDDVLARSQPDIVFVGLGFPKQDKLIAELRPAMPDTWFVSCGISFSFLSGEVRRAPPFLQRLGLEWVHRLVQEPGRLAKRYLVHGLPFSARLLAAALAQRKRQRTLPEPAADRGSSSEDD